MEKFIKSSKQRQDRKEKNKGDIIYNYQEKRTIDKMTMNPNYFKDREYDNGLDGEHANMKPISKGSKEKYGLGKISKKYSSKKGRKGGSSNIYGGHSYKIKQG